MYRQNDLIKAILETLYIDDTNVLNVITIFNQNHNYYLIYAT